MRRSMVAGVALALGMGYSAAQAEIVTFQSLLDGDSITAADKVFSDFTLDFEFADGAALPDYSLIGVTPLVDGGTDPGPGLRFDFNDQLTVAGVTDPDFEFLEFIDITFSFLVTSTDTPIKDNSLLLDAELTNPQLDVGAFVLETVFAPDGEQIASKEAELSFLAGANPELVDIPTDSAEFDPLQSILVTKNIFVGATLDGEIASVNGVEQRFSQVGDPGPPSEIPMPATGALLAMGFLGLSAIRRRRRGA